MIAVMHPDQDPGDADRLRRERTSAMSANLVRNAMYVHRSSTARHRPPTSPASRQDAAIVGTFALSLITPTEPEREMTTAGGNSMGPEIPPGITRPRPAPIIVPPNRYDRDDERGPSRAIDSSCDNLYTSIKNALLRS